MYPLDGNTLLRIDGETRESVCEVLFEQDNDCMSVATMVLDALLACPIDLRYQLFIQKYKSTYDSECKLFDFLLPVDLWHFCSCLGGI